MSKASKPFNPGRFDGAVTESHYVTIGLKRPILPFAVSMV